MSDGNMNAIQHLVLSMFFALILLAVLVQAFN